MEKGDQRHSRVAQKYFVTITDNCAAAQQKVMQDKRVIGPVILERLRYYFVLFIEIRSVVIGPPNCTCSLAQRNFWSVINARVTNGTPFFAKRG